MIPFGFWRRSRIISTGLVLYLDAANTSSYPGTGTTWSDLSGNGNNATLSGPTFQTTNGGQFNFNGTTNFASSPNATSLNPSSQITLSLWLSSEDSSDYRSPCMKTSTFNWDNGYGFYNEAGNFRFFINLWDGPQTVSISRTTFSIRNIVGVYDGTNLKLYENGNLVATGSSFNSAITNSSTQLLIGQGGGNPTEYHWDGVIAQTLIYNRGLSSVEVLQNYNAEKGRFGL